MVDVSKNLPARITSSYYSQGVLSYDSNLIREFTKNCNKVVLNEKLIKSAVRDLKITYDDPDFPRFCPQVSVELMRAAAHIDIDVYTFHGNSEDSDWMRNGRTVYVKTIDIDLTYIDACVTMMEILNEAIEEFIKLGIPVAAKRARYNII